MNNTSAASGSSIGRKDRLRCKRKFHSFEGLTHQKVCQWGLFNGSDGYNLCGVDEYALMKRIILEAPKDQKEFYALDIGAGNFQWGIRTSEKAFIA